MDQSRIKKFQVSVIFKTRAELVMGLEQIAHEIEDRITDDVGNDYIGEVQSEDEKLTAGYAYHIEEYEYADIYGNAKEAHVKDTTKTEKT
jgi:hypothetical protein